MDNDWMIGAIGIGIVGMSLINRASPSPTYIYTVNVSNFTCKNWQYIESRPYQIVLYPGDSISLNITYNLNYGQVIDIVDVRFHNISGMIEGYGKIYATVNGSPALPTIGTVNQNIPIYVAFPSYPNYGTVFTTIWDTDDVKGPGTYNYTYTYEGITPLYIKSLELYVASKY